MQQRFLNDIERLCRVDADGRIVMLSGGVDSFLLLAAVSRLYDASDIEALIIYGIESSDSARAKQAAKFFNVKLIEREVMMGEILDNLSMLKGTQDKSVFQALFRISTEIAFADLNVKGKAIYQGDGADSLYGNSNHFIYMATKEMAAEKFITKDEARDILRAANRRKIMSGSGTGTGKLIGEIIEAHGAIPVQPFISGELEYLLQVPLKCFQGETKKWVKDALINLWGLPVELVRTRKRCSMQDGLGYYKLLNDELKKIYKTQSANAAIKYLCQDN